MKSITIEIMDVAGAPGKYTAMMNISESISHPVLMKYLLHATTLVAKQLIEAHPKDCDCNAPQIAGKVIEAFELCPETV